MRSGRAWLVIVAAVATAALGATSAPAAGIPDGYVPWPSALPGRTVGPAGPPKGVPHCRRLRLRCVDRVIVRLRREWRAQDRRCDHRAVFSLGYLRISREIRTRLAQHRTFRHRRWFIAVIQGFSNIHFQTEADYDAGRQVPDAWRIYYRAMDSGDYSAGQDLLLASNAHTNHDLPYAYAASGLLTRKGVSRKHDHDAVNEVNATVFRGIARYYADHYDPAFSLFNTIAPFDQLTAGQVVQMWRENAWRQAERLVGAKSRAELRGVQRDIEVTSTAWARMITGGAFPGYRATRDAYCREQQLSG